MDDGRSGTARGVRRAHPDRDVRALFTLVGASGAALLPFFALLLRDRGFAADEIGLLLALSSLAGVMASPVWSHVADTSMGTVWTIRLASTVSASVALLLLLTGGDLRTTLVAVVALGAAQGPGTALVDTMALSHLGAERMTEYGSIRLWASLGWAVAVLAFGAWFERAGLGPVLPAYAAGTALYVAVTLRFRQVRPPRGPAHGSRLGALGETFRESPRLLPFLVGLVLVSIATWGAWSFVPLRIASRGGGPFLVGLAASVTAFIEIPFFRASGRLGAHVGLRLLFVAGCAVYVAMLVGLAIVKNPVGIAVIKMTGGAGFGLTYAALVVITSTLVPERLRTTGQALMQISTIGMGPVIGAAVGGLVYRHLGPPTLFFGAAMLTAAGAAVVWRALSGAISAPGGEPATGVV